MLYHLTHYCNFNCPHCFVEASEQGKHATTDVTHGFVEFAKRTGTVKIGIAGGEPTLHPNFKEHLLYIIGSLPKKIIILMTNGQFLLHDTETINFLADCCKLPYFFIQVSSLKELYPHRKAILEAFGQAKHMFGDRMMLIEDITCIEHLGKATGKNFGVGVFARKAPSCFNLFSISRNVESFVDVISYFDNATNGFCKPLVTPEGNVHVGESQHCIKLGNITDSDEVLFDTLVKSKPCGKCGVKSPIQF